NAAVKTAAVDELKKQGCRVLVSDLYEVKFKATATEDDITGAVKNPEHFCYGNETMLAWQEARLASDIVDEHKKLKEADLVIFQDKKAMLSFTTGSHETMFSSNGINGDMNVTLWPIQNGVLNYCGFQVLAPQIFWAPTHLSPEAREGLLEGWRTRLQGLLNEGICPSCTLISHFLWKFLRGMSFSATKLFSRCLQIML
uniref:Flavodoxin-like fold domain-containing protein n=1 Tax=Sinocyclocheilus grahami TaxID=75366 RepID=A0A672NMF8_SINGR